MKSKVTSKFVSLDNGHYEPLVGDIAIKSDNTHWSANAKVRSLDNVYFKPQPPKFKILNYKLDWKSDAKVNSFENIDHMKAYSEVKIVNELPKWKKESKIKSLENVCYKSQGGNKVIEEHSLEWNSTPRIGSLDNINYIPKGGNVKIKTHKTKWKGESKIGSMDRLKYINHVMTDIKEQLREDNDSLSGSFEHLHIPKYHMPYNIRNSPQNKMYRPEGGYINHINKQLRWNGSAKVGSLDNMHHSPGGGENDIFDEKPDWVAQSRVGSLNNMTHKPGGGDVKIRNEKLAWKGKSKVGSLRSLYYIPEGRDIIIQQLKANWQNEHFMQNEHNPRFQNVEKRWNSLPKLWSPDHNSQPESSAIMGGYPVESKFLTARKRWNARTKIDPIDKYTYFYPLSGGYQPPYKGHEDSTATNTAPRKKSHAVRYKHVKSKVASLDNVEHVPSGGTKQIFSQTLNWKVEPRTDSIGNFHHQPRARVNMRDQCMLGIVRIYIINTM